MTAICKLEGCERPPRSWSHDAVQTNNRWRTTPRLCKKHAAANQNLRAKFGLTIEDYLKMYADQKGLCAVCEAPGLPAGEQDQKGPRTALVVDHNHAGGEVRGLLCWPCNVVLGFCDDDPARLRLLAEWVS